MSTPIFDRDVNILIKTIQQNTSKINLSVGNFVTYTKKGVSYCVANFGGSYGNTIKFKLNKNGGVDEMTVTHKTAVNFPELLEEYADIIIQRRIIVINDSFFKNTGLSAPEMVDFFINFQNKIIDVRVKNIKKKSEEKNILPLIISDSVWCSQDNRYYKCYMRMDNDKVCCTISAYR